jgi:hypothetical protein
MPESIEINTDAARCLYPDAEYTLWGGEDLRDFIGLHFGKEVLWGFDVLRPYSYKCDLARFCLMHALGGLYVDLGVQLLEHWHIPQTHRVAACRDVAFLTSDWATMQTGLIWSMPDQPEYLRAIEFILENCRARYYGKGPLHPTGPVLLGKAMLAAVNERDWSQPDGQWIGSCQCITPDSSIWNMSYVAPDGRIIALRTKAVPGDLSHLGIVGGNNYNFLWQRRVVYGERHHVHNFASYPFISQNLSRLRHGVRVKPGFSGHVSWGPYVTLSDGIYRATFTVAEGAVASQLRIDVCSNQGNKLIAQRLVEKPFNRGATAVSLCFEIEDNEDDIECRMEAFGDFDGTVVSLVLESLPQRRWSCDHFRIRAVEGAKSAAGISIGIDASGIICCGPQITIHEGDYELEVFFGPVASNAGEITVEVCADLGRRALAPSLRLDATELNHARRSLAFSCAREARDVEFRIYSSGQVAATILGFALNDVSNEGSGFGQTHVD